MEVWAMPVDNEVDGKLADLVGSDEWHGGSVVFNLSLTTVGCAPSGSLQRI